MIWGAGRLLFRVLIVAGIGVVTLWRKVAGSELRSMRRLATAVLVVALLGGGSPLFVRTPSDGSDVRTRAIGSPDGRSFDDVAVPLRGRASFSFEGPVQSVDLPAPSAVQKRTALIIGINNARGGGALPGSITDARNMRDALLGYGFPSKNITMLLDKQASASGIRRGLADLAMRTPSDGVAVFAVATHTRRRGGRNSLLAADGQLIGASELASALGRVRSKMWVALPTCYAAGYALQGIVGPGRVATFASPSGQQTYQLGSAGSYLVINMVREAMLAGRAPGSVEDAFRYAKATLERDHPGRVPIMSDGVKGELVLGRMSSSAFARSSAGREQRKKEGEAVYFSPAESDPAPAEGAEPEQPQPRRRYGVGVCGRLSYNCSSDD